MHNNEHCKIWSSENTPVLRDKSSHPQKPCVLLALSRRSLVGPIFFNPALESEKFRDIIRESVSVSDEDKCCSATYCTCG